MCIEEWLANDMTDTRVSSREMLKKLVRSLMNDFIVWKSAWEILPEESRIKPRSTLAWHFSVHLNPSPIKPLPHEQMKDPTVLLQFAFG